MRIPNSPLMKVTYAVGGLIAGGVLATTVGAQAATTPSTGNSTSSSSTAADPHPGDKGADGVPEAQEVHDGHGGVLDKSGTVTAVGSASITIRTSSSTATYVVASATDIDKNGEASLSAIAVGDKVTFSVDTTNAKQIDKLHAGDESKNMPAPPSGSTAQN